MSELDTIAESLESASTILKLAHEVARWDWDRLDQYAPDEQRWAIRDLARLREALGSPASYQPYEVRR